MEVTRKEVGDVVILDLDGKLTIGKGDVVLRGAFVDELDVGQRKLVVNLDKVKVIDSSGLGELIRCKVTASEKEADVKLLHVNLKARKLITMAQLVGVFEMFDDEEMAIAVVLRRVENDPNRARTETKRAGLRPCPFCFRSPVKAALLGQRDVLGDLHHSSAVSSLFSAWKSRVTLFGGRTSSKISAYSISSSSMALSIEKLWSSRIRDSLGRHVGIAAEKDLDDVDAFDPTARPSWRRTPHRSARMRRPPHR
jgi:anti-sigma B factor antagonist